MGVIILVIILVIIPEIIVWSARTMNGPLALGSISLMQGSTRMSHY